MEDKIITFISLGIAFLAVIISPIISFIVTNRQIKSSLDIVSRQIISPMRQKWINNLRDLIAEFLSRVTSYWITGIEKRNDLEYQKLLELEYKLSLFINPKEKDHNDLIYEFKLLLHILNMGGTQDDLMFEPTRDNIVKISQKIIKSEWNRVKDETKKQPLLKKLAVFRVKGG